MKREASAPWSTTTMGDASSLKGRLGWQGLKAAHYRESGPYVVSSAHFEKERIRWEMCPRVTAERYETDVNIQLREGDALLMKDGAALGKIAYVDALPGPACLNSHLLLFRPIGGAYEPQFIFYTLGSRAFQSYIRVHATGLTFLGISQRAVARFPLELPPIPEQRQIAAILDTLDDAIRKTEQIIAKLKQVKQGLLHDLLTRGIDDNGELRDPERHPEQFKESALGRIPKAWEVSTLGDEAGAPICYGIVQAGPFVVGGPQVLTIGDLRGDFRSGIHRTSPSIEQQYARSRVGPGDLLLSIKGTIGRIAVVPRWYSGNISRDLARVRLGPRVLAEFLRQFLLSLAGQRLLELAVVGTTRAEISIHVLKRVLCPVPSLPEQEEIVVRASAADATLTTASDALAKYRLLKSGLTEDLLTGRVRVTALLKGSTE